MLGSDWHLWKTRSRTGVDPTQLIIDNFQRCIGPSDAFIFLGDFTSRESVWVRRKDIAFAIHGIHARGKVLILGNNDVLSPEYYLQEYGFDSVVGRFEWRNIIFTHEPAKCPPGMINVHGHIHESDEYWEVPATGHF